MSKLIMLRGNSGSGKTTVAKALQRKIGPNTMLLSQDVIRREVLWVGDGQEPPALPLLEQMLRYGHAHCETVILEGILNRAWYQDLFLCARELFGPDIYAYYYDLPFAETLRRHQTKPNRDDFGERELRSWWNERDVIGWLPETILTQDLSLEETVALIGREVFGPL